MWDKCLNITYNCDITFFPQDPPVTIQDNQPQEHSNVDTVQHRDQTGSSWKLTIWMSAWKVIFTIAFSFLLTRSFIKPEVRMTSSYWEGWEWEELKDFTRLLLYFLGNIIGSLLGEHTSLFFSESSICDLN